MKEYARLAALFCLVVLLIPVAAAGVIGGRTGQQALGVLSEQSDILLYLDEATGRVERVSTLDYIRGAIAAEMPPTFHPEALAAQGLSAHTRAMYLKQLAMTAPDPDLKGAYFTANPSQNEGFVPPGHMQALYGENYDIHRAALDKAANYAKDRLITYGGQPILAAYHAMSNGYTEESGNVWPQQLPYLVAVESEGDTFAPDYKVELHLAAVEVERIAKEAYSGITFPASVTNYITILERSAQNYVLRARLGDREITGRELRTLFGLRSACFSVEAEKNGLVFVTKGYGHGVGLSQQGADFMARQGSTAEEIALHYYSGCEVTHARAV